MSKKTSALHSSYIIDGIPQDLTPAEMLAAVTDPLGLAGTGASEGVEQIVDETLDPILDTFRLDASRLDEYLDDVMSTDKLLPLAFSDTYTRLRLAAALIDAIWCRGNFRFQDLQLKAAWKWNSSSVGSNAAFFSSVQGASEYIDDLGLKFSSYSCCRTQQACDISFKPVLADTSDIDDDVFIRQPGRSEHPRLGTARACPVSLVDDPESWIVYVPFETSDYRLGGSLLAQTLGLGGGVPPQIGDADYFVDCYEVVREFVEDRILLSGNTVRQGGLLKALKQMTSDTVGATIDLSGLMRASGEKDVVRLLFSEVPGVLFQIKDIDFDYIDAELLLQDVAFFPLGHPVSGSSDVRVKASAKSGIQTILETLILNAEGED